MYNPDYRMDNRTPYMALVKIKSYDELNGIDAAYFDHPGFGEKLIPVSWIYDSFSVNGTSIRRKGLPLTLSYAMTIHKAQGRSLDKVVVITDGLETAKEAHTLFYVAVTRAKKALQMFFKGDVFPKVLWEGITKSYHQDFVREERRISDLADRESGGAGLSGTVGNSTAPSKNSRMAQAFEAVRKPFRSRKWFKDIFANLPEISRSKFDKIIKNRMNLSWRQKNFTLKQENHDSFQIKYRQGNRCATQSKSVGMFSECRPLYEPEEWVGHDLIETLQLEWYRFLPDDRKDKVIFFGPQFSMFINGYKQTACDDENITESFGQNETLESEHDKVIFSDYFKHPALPEYFKTTREFLDN